MTYQFYLGADLGQAADRTAVITLERLYPTHVPPEVQRIIMTRTVRRLGSNEVLSVERHAPPDDAPTDTAPPQPVYLCRHIKRLPLHVDYTDVVRYLRGLMQSEQLRGKTRLVIDASSVGRGIRDMLARAGCPPLAITIHGGDTVTQAPPCVRVPKRDLVSVVRRLLDERRLKIDRNQPDAEVLRRELQNFKIKINPETAHDSYSAWREGDHDDMVLAVAVAAWAAEHGPKPTVDIPSVSYSGY